MAREQAGSTVNKEPRVILNDPNLVEFIFSHCKREDDCLVWQRSGNQYGYGQIKIRQVKYATHRLIALAFCETPFDLNDSNISVCHTCDNPPCNEPTHLVVADQSYNIKDAYAKGHRVSPMRSFRVMTEDEVQEIRSLYATTVPNYSELGRMYNVDPQTIRQIVLRITYKNVPDLSGVTQ